MKLIPTTAVALTLIAAVAPFAAFAQDTGTSANVSVGATVQTSSSTGALGALRGLVPGALRARFEANHEGSSTGLRAGANASTTRMRGGMGNNGAAARSRGDSAIDARIASLNQMITRLSSAQRLSADAKASLTATLNASIASLTSLKTEIDTGATTTLKTDDQSITKDFRIYALVMPQAAIDAASDRVMTIVADMQTLSAKIGTRISAAQASGADVSAAIAAHTDFDAKVADASTQAQAAVSETASLQPDNGDATLMASNTATLKDAKSKLDAAQADLKAARADVTTILAAIKGKGEVKATATTTAQ
jgi:hypothetical protein